MFSSTAIRERISTLRRTAIETKGWIPFLAGLLMTAAAILLVRDRIDRERAEETLRSRPVAVVVASRPIRAGDRFSEENLARKEIPASGTGRRNVPAGEFELLLHSTSRGEIDPGEPILWTDVEEPFESDGFSRAIRPGQVALTLEVDASASFAGLVRTGDRIDLLCRPGNVWVRGIPVLAVDRQFDRTGTREDGEIATLTLSVSPEEGARIAKSEREGGISWFLRNPDDNVPVVKPRPNRTRPAVVEVWRGGIPDREFRRDGGIP